MSLLKLKMPLAFVLAQIFAWPLAAQDWQKAKQVLTTRCVSCHSCFSSPCQLNLTSYAGLARGASKNPVYDGTRLTPAQPTRMYIDAHTTQAWRHRYHFFPVIPEGPHKASLFMDMIQLGMDRGNRFKGKQFETQTNQVCPHKGEEWKAFEKDLLRGMPFGFPTLNPQEFQTIQKWAANGYKAEEPTISEQLNALPSKEKKSIEKWEAFLNKRDLKSRIVARYLYEHWFIAHLQFSSDSKHFFRIVRTRNPMPQTPEEQATRRPFDPPVNELFYYRFVPVQGPIMHKTHIVYLADQKTYEFVQQELLKGRWQKNPSQFPAYGDAGANPISTFQDMPAKGRYRFFLRDTRYFAMTFIRGPVCEGQIAVNVIEDHFQVFFLDPDTDLSVQEPDYLREAATMLELPAKGENDPIESFYLKYKAQQLKYLKFRAARYRAKDVIYSPKILWNGEGTDEDAVLTIYRHFDNAGVIRGAWGGPPKTLWVMDYPIFERMYYLLVAGFDVFGNVFHQTSTRMYMDNLRMEAENNFIYMFDEKTREAIRNRWYVGKWAREKIAEANPLHSDSYRSDTKAPKPKPDAETAVQELRETILSKRMAKVTNSNDTFYPRMVPSKPSPLLSLTAQRGGFSSYMPELTLLVIEEKGHQPEVISLSKVVAHTSVSFLLIESARLEPKEDRLSIVPKWIGSYPNFFIQLDKSELPKFVNELQQAKTKKQVEHVLGQYGVARDHTDFWSRYDRMEADLFEQFPVEYGRLDLSKYANIY